MEEVTRMDNRIPSLQYALFAEAFWKFASMARQYHFYDAEVARMEQSMLDMNPFPQRKDDVK